MNGLKQVENALLVVVLIEIKGDNYKDNDLDPLSALQESGTQPLLTMVSGYDYPFGSISTNIILL